jgi:hypothetical protein
MAEIHLITGQPGHGKSLYAITLGLAFVREGREVYAAGFKNLDYAATGFKELPHEFPAYDPAEKDDQGRILTKWQQLPHGSVIILDECYDYIPQRGPGRPVPPHVDALARHRHTGHDIILVTQKHDQIDSFVKGLIGQHTHVRRKFGWNAAALRKWDRFSQNVMANDTVAIERWAYPKKNYALYTSATQHSVKKTVPWFVIVLPIMLLAVPALGWYAWHGFKENAGVAPTESGALATGAVGASPRADVVKADENLRARDYATWVHPRIAGQPWTAPAYDQLQVQAMPEVYCIAAEDLDCKCITEQGTTYAMEATLCRTIARNGTYNPFRSRSVRGGDQGQAKGAAPEPRSVLDDAAALPVASAGGSRFKAQTSIPQSYVPPQLTTVDPL